jgi:hypothetical protein
MDPAENQRWDSQSHISQISSSRSVIVYNLTTQVYQHRLFILLTSFNNA